MKEYKVGDKIPYEDIEEDLRDAQRFRWFVCKGKDDEAIIEFVLMISNGSMSTLEDFRVWCDKWIEYRGD